MTLDVALRLSRGRFALDAAFASSVRTLAVVGASGAGKSTLLALLAGLARPEAGHVRLGPGGGEESATLVDVAAGVFVPPRARRVGLVSQKNDLFPHLSVGENLALAERYAPRDGAGRGGDRGSAAAPREELVRALGLGSLLSVRADRLSGGEAKRAQLVRALLNRPRLLLLDEPFAALDEATRDDALGALLSLREATRVPIVVVTHRPAEAAALADEAVALAGGRVVARGAPLDVLGRADVLGGEHVGEVETFFAATAESASHGRVGDRPVTADFGAAPRGARVWFALRASDVVLAGAPPAQSSARHAWPARVAAVTELGVQPVVSLAVEGLERPLLSRVSTESAAELALAPGREIVAVFKAAALRRL